MHISDIVAKAHKRSAATRRALVHMQKCSLACVDVRPLVEHDCVLWDRCTVKDIEALESVQRCFTKRLPGHCLTYTKRPKRTNLPSLELHVRRLHTGMFMRPECYENRNENEARGVRTRTRPK